MSEETKIWKRGPILGDHESHTYYVGGKAAGSVHRYGTRWVCRAAAQASKFVDVKDLDAGKAMIEATSQ